MDSKLFQDVKASDPYQGVDIVKGECVGHVRKRVGTRLRILKECYRGKVLSDNKKLFGKGRLTEKVINTLQNYQMLVIIRFRKKIGHSISWGGGGGGRRGVDVYLALKSIYHKLYKIAEKLTNLISLGVKNYINTNL